MIVRILLLILTQFSLYPCFVAIERAVATVQRKSLGRNAGTFTSDLPELSKKTIRELQNREKSLVREFLKSKLAITPQASKERISMSVELLSSLTLGTQLDLPSFAELVTQAIVMNNLSGLTSHIKAIKEDVESLITSATNMVAILNGKSGDKDEESKNIILMQERLVKNATDLRNRLNSSLKVLFLPLKFSALSLAIFHNSVDCFKYLLENELYEDVPETSLHWKLNPIHYACFNDNEEILQLLISKKFDCKRSSHLGLQPVHCSALADSVHCIKILADMGIDLNEVADKSGNTPLHFAVINQNSKVIAFLLNSKAKINVRNYDGFTPLHLAVLQTQDDFELLSAKDSKAKAEQSTSSSTDSTSFASSSSMIEKIDNNNTSATCLNLLLRAKADTSIANNGGTFPLHSAVFQNNVEHVEALLKAGADADVKTATNGVTPLFIAAARENISICTLLLKFGANINVHTFDGMTPLHHVADKGKDTALAFLIANKANIEAKDSHGSTPLHYAVLGNAKCVKILIAAGAKNDVKNNDGIIPFTIARSKPNNNEVIAELGYWGCLIQ